MGDGRIDFEAEGLLEGTEGSARDERLTLLRELEDDGAGLGELRAAVDEDRLALLPAERVLGGEGRYTLEEVAEQAGIDSETLHRQLRSLGLPTPAEGDPAFTDQDLEAARLTKLFLDAGLPEPGILEVSRTMGMSMSQVAAATRRLVGEASLEGGGSEREIGLRIARAARELGPMVGPLLQYVYIRHLREQISQDVIGRSELTSGQLVGSQEVTVCFADLVGFTSLSERLEIEAIGEVSGRLGELAAEVAEPPVRLVKLIGDAAMLVSAETEPVLDAGLRLIESTGPDNDLPEIKVGVARGDGLTRGGDWYGRPVNLASRITAAARPASALVNSEVRDTAGEAFSFSRAGPRHFKGISEAVVLYRARRAEEGS